ncbi:hypothetical protein OBBRIDRAFT_422493 [Obba rivulosa]|uniref:Uncharacterized protein n=1 Tax=Obba rivulosa TaxID=1052685 RepID=A0A8E2B2U1_9APHY|nr:hypothetical protein OBBRIDRAFT_422493 [Obba rivulosa]
MDCAAADRRDPRRPWSPNLTDVIGRGGVGDPSCPFGLITRLSARHRRLCSSAACRGAYALRLLGIYRQCAGQRCGSPGRTHRPTQGRGCGLQEAGLISPVTTTPSRSLDARSQRLSYGAEADAAAKRVHMLLPTVVQALACLSVLPHLWMTSPARQRRRIDMLPGVLRRTGTAAGDIHSSPECFCCLCPAVLPGKMTHMATCHHLLPLHSSFSPITYKTLHHIPRLHFPLLPPPLNTTVTPI